MADLDTLTVKQLQDEADSRGLDTGGTKAELLARIQEADAAAPEVFVPKVGELVDDGAGRFGLVVGPGREPDPAKGESPEPLVAWLPAAGPYGGTLAPAAS